MAQTAEKSEKSEKSQKEHVCENPFAGFDLPPCAKFLNNFNPLVNENGQCIIVNYNRVYCFLNLNCQQGENPFFPDNPVANYSCHTAWNYQISFANYLIAIFVHQIQLGHIKKEKQMAIHENPLMNDMINSLLDEPPQLEAEQEGVVCIPSVMLHCSNSNAVMPLYVTTTNISPLNFYIVVLLILFEQDAGLYLGNNAYVTPDAINYQLSSLYFPCPNPNYGNCGMPCDFCGNPWSCSGEKREAYREEESFGRKKEKRDKKAKKQSRKRERCSKT